MGFVFSVRGIKPIITIFVLTENIEEIEKDHSNSRIQ